MDFAKFKNLGFTSPQARQLKYEIQGLNFRHDAEPLFSKDAIQPIIANRPSSWARWEHGGVPHVVRILLQTFETLCIEAGSHLSAAVGESGNRVEHARILLQAMDSNRSMRHGLDALRSARGTPDYSLYICAVLQLLKSQTVSLIDASERDFKRAAWTDLYFVEESVAVMRRALDLVEGEWGLLFIAILESLKKIHAKAPPGDFAALLWELSGDGILAANVTNKKTHEHVRQCLHFCVSYWPTKERTPVEAAALSPFLVDCLVVMEEHEDSFKEWMRTFHVTPATEVLASNLYEMTASYNLPLKRFMKGRGADRQLSVVYCGILYYLQELSRNSEALLAPAEGTILQAGRKKDWYETTATPTDIVWAQDVLATLPEENRATFAAICLAFRRVVALRQNRLKLINEIRRHLSYHSFKHWKKGDIGHALDNFVGLCIEDAHLIFHEYTLTRVTDKTLRTP